MTRTTVYQSLWNPAEILGWVWCVVIVSSHYYSRDKLTLGSEQLPHPTTLSIYDYYNYNTCTELME